MNVFEDKNITRYDYGDYEILYSPIARRIAVVAKADADGAHCEQEQSSGNGLCGAIHTLDEVRQTLTDYTPISQQKKVRMPEDYTLLTILPNNTCNFACSYCYSALGRNHSVLPPDKMRAAIRYFIASKPEGFAKPLSISFMGGGEPMLSWENVREAIVYAESLAEERGLRLNISVITNGSVVNREAIDFFLRHKINVSVSFEILEDVQNAQRKNHQLVSNNIRTLCQAGVAVQINATITPLNVERMTLMLTTAIADFPHIEGFMFEPATGEAIYTTTENIHNFYHTYLQQFRQCLSIANERGVSLTSFAFLRTVYPLERACPGEFCLTADGFITGCYCVSSPREPLFPLTRYGEVVGDEIVFDIDRFRALLNVNVYSNPLCQDCEARWNCGGGCFHQYQSYSQPFRDEVCLFTRRFVEMIVKYRVEKHLKRSTNPRYPLIIKL